MKRWVFLFLLAAPPAFAQDVICCNHIYDVNGPWIGLSRDCVGFMEKATPAVRRDVCQSLIAADLLCGDVVPFCDCEKLLAEAQADYDRLLAAARDQDKAGDAIFDEIDKAVKRVEGEIAAQLKEEAMTVGSPNVIIMNELMKREAGMGTVDTALENPADYYSKAMNDIEKVGRVIPAEATWNVPVWAKRAFETGSKAAGWAALADFVIDWTNVDAKVIVTIQEIDRYGDQAVKSAESATDTYRKAKLAESRLFRLRIACMGAKGRPVPTGTTPPEDRTVLTGEDAFNERLRLSSLGREKGQRAFEEWQKSKDEIEMAKSMVERYLKPAPGGRHDPEPMDDAAKADYYSAHWNATVGSMANRAGALRTLDDARSAYKKASAIHILAAPAPKPTAPPKKKTQ